MGRIRRSARPITRLVQRIGLCALLALSAAPSPAAAQTPYGDDELIQGFLLTVFGAEVGSTPRDIEAASVVKKFTGPVSYTIVSATRPNQSASVRAFMAELSGAVEGLTLVEAAPGEDPAMTVFLVARRDYVPTIRAKVWPGVDTAFLESNACSAVIAARRAGIEKAFVFLVADEGFLPLAHCMVEEIAQSLGPANDSDLLPDSIFNDSSDVNVFSVFDWYILNMLYDPRVQAGMTIDQVSAILPAVIADARLRLPEIMAHRPAIAAHAAFTRP
ncbi:DUF2927 domain-containing protein [Acuticoccus yangtzensis]|uniref:DUF2927 domain-containing protein n=1 Tax=Acuticoccus yangtzensis TaxID=1443441 RepID=UPI0009498603|nr:DUF2927 domain-containing protein [Acuticoccus yangtzensis]